MITIKSKEEIELMKEAGKVTADPESEYAFVYLHIDDEGTAEVKDIVAFMEPES